MGIIKRTQAMTKIILAMLALTFGCMLTFESVNAAEGYTPPQKFTRVFKQTKDSAFFNKKNQRQNKRQHDSRQQNNTASSDEERTASMDKTSNTRQQSRQVRKSRHSTPSQKRAAQRNAPRNSSSGGLNN
jgi:hypothetical protein